jgi:hypothetical protein
MIYIMSKKSTSTKTPGSTEPLGHTANGGMSREVIEQRRIIVQDVMLKNPTLGCEAIASQLGVSRSSIRRMYDALRKKIPGAVKFNGNQFTKPGGQKISGTANSNLTNLGFAAAAAASKPLPLGEREQLESRIDAVKDEAKEQERRVEYWRQQCQTLEQQLKQYQATWDHVPYAYKIPITCGGNKSETIPVLMASDWHVEEPVNPQTILGANEFSLDIAHKSILELAKTAIRLSELKRAGTRINQMVLWLGGDFITGFIHDENKSSCMLSPIEATLWAEDRIYTLIEHLLKEGKFDQLTIRCSCGNHSRTTLKKNIAQQSEMSFEWGMYNHLSREFKNDPRVKFVLTPGYLTTTTLFDKYKLRFHHGDAIRFKDGVGGLTIPLNKRIAKWNENGREVYLDCIGHWHSYMPGRKAIVNGSLIGYNAFAQECGFAVEPPEQTLFFVEKKGSSEKFVLRDSASPGFGRLEWPGPERRIEEQDRGYPPDLSRSKAAPDRAIPHSQRA